MAKANETRLEKLLGARERLKAMFDMALRLAYTTDDEDKLAENLKYISVYVGSGLLVVTGSPLFKDVPCDLEPLKTL